MSHLDGELGIGLDARCSLRSNLKVHPQFYLNVAYCLNIVTAYIHNMYYQYIYHMSSITFQFNSIAHLWSINILHSLYRTDNLLMIYYTFLHLKYDLFSNYIK